MRTFSSITSRRPFTLLGVLLALLVIVAFVLVALNASAANATSKQTVVVASRDLQPRVPITANSLSTLQIPTGTWADYFTSQAQLVGMVPLVTIGSGRVITANEVDQAPQYSVQVRDWKAGSEVAADDFSFNNTTSAKKVDPKDLGDTDELPNQLTTGGAQ